MRGKSASVKIRKRREVRRKSQRVGRQVKANATLPEKSRKIVKKDARNSLNSRRNLIFRRCELSALR